MTRWSDPPRWLLVLSWVLLLAGVAAVLAGAVTIGVTVDEKYHVVRLQSYLDVGWYLLEDDLAPTGPGWWVNDAFVYAPVTTLLLHLLNVAVGNDSWGQVSTTADAYAVRHLGIALMSMATVAAVAAMTRIVSGSWRWGVVSAAVLMSLPMWTGHAMFNVKDIPVATGYSLVTLGCMMLLRADRDHRARWVSAGALVCCGMLLALGTRPAMWPALGAACAWVVLVVVLKLDGLTTCAWWRVVVLVIASGLAMAILVVVYPSVFSRVATWPMASTAESAGYQGPRFWAYIPLAVFLTVPALLLLVGTGGILARSMQWLARGRRLSPGTVVLALVLLQALLLPGILTIRVASMNVGLRHVLFAAPAVAILLTSGLEQVLRDLSSRTARRVGSLVIAVALVVPAMAQAQSFPYNYGYSNGLADSMGLSLATDPWQGSFRRYADVLSPRDFVVCGPDLDEQDRPLRSMTTGGPWLALGQNCQQGNSVLSPYMEADPSSTSVPGDFVALMYWFDPAPRGCVEIARVTRRRLLSVQTVSKALRCPLVLPPYDGPVRVNGGGTGSAFLLGGWNALGGDPWVSVEEHASLGFSLPSQAGSASIEVHGEGEGAVEFFINNQPAEAERTSTGWRLTVPSSLPQLGQHDNVVLTLVPGNGATARVSGFEVAQGVS